MDEDRKTELRAKMEKLEDQMNDAEDVRTQNMLMSRINEIQRELYAAEKM